MNWTTDQGGEALPQEFGQMHQVAVLPVSPDWFAQQGVNMREAEVEPGWPLTHGVVRTDDGPFVVIGEPDGDGVALYALADMAPADAVSRFAQAMGHGAEPLHVTPDPVSDDGALNVGSEGPAGPVGL